MDYDNGVQDTSNFDDSYNSSYPYSNDTRQDSYESQRHETHDRYSSGKEHDSPKIAESRNVEFNLPPTSDETSNLIDVHKDSFPLESQESTPQPELGNYESSIIDHFDAALVNPHKDTGSLTDNQNFGRNGNDTFNPNDTPDKEDVDCCGCTSGPLMCFAIFCDCFGI